MHPGDIIFNFNDSSNDIFLLIDGEVVITGKNTAGQTAPIAKITKNCVFRQYASINGNACKTSAKASNACKYVAFPCNLYIKIKGEMPSSDFIANITPELQTLFPAESISIPTNCTVDIKSILPDGHPLFDAQEGEQAAIMLYEKDALCPLCEKEFKIKSIRKSKLHSQQTDHDFRPHYEAFEPIWYSVSVCPFCGYANLVSEYEKLSSVQKSAIKKSGCLKNGNFLFSEPRTINEVLAAHYLAINTCDAGSTNDAVKARLWHNLAWLYSDMQDNDLYKTSIKKALDNYMKAFYGTAKETSIEKEQKAQLLLGALNMIIENYKEATRHFYTAINRKMGNKVFNTMAEDRLDEAKAASATADKETVTEENAPESIQDIS